MFDRLWLAMALDIIKIVVKYYIPVVLLYIIAWYVFVTAPQNHALMASDPYFYPNRPLYIFIWLSIILLAGVLFTVSITTATGEANKVDTFLLAEREVRRMIDKLPSSRLSKQEQRLVATVTYTEAVKRYVAAANRRSIH